MYRTRALGRNGSRLVCVFSLFLVAYLAVFSTLWLAYRPRCRHVAVVPEAAAPARADIASGRRTMAGRRYVVARAHSGSLLTLALTSKPDVVKTWSYLSPLGCWREKRVDAAIRMETDARGRRHHVVEGVGRTEFWGMNAAQLSAFMMLPPCE